jgi:hypothetical protein
MSLNGTIIALSSRLASSAIANQTQTRSSSICDPPPPTPPPIPAAKSSHRPRGPSIARDNETTGRVRFWILFRVFRRAIDPIAALRRKDSQRRVGLQAPQDYRPRYRPRPEKRRRRLFFGSQRNFRPRWPVLPVWSALPRSWIPGLLRVTRGRWTRPIEPGLPQTPPWSAMPMATIGRSESSTTP